MKKRLYLLAIMAIFALNYGLAVASSPTPAPVCHVAGTVISSEFKAAFDEKCLTEPGGCPSDMATSHPDIYYMDIKIDSTTYVSGSTNYSTCASWNPAGETKQFSIMADKVTSTDFTTGKVVGKKISGDAIRRSFDSLSLENVTGEDGGQRVCLMVITKAKNRTTGEIKEFPDSCLPEGWDAVSENVEVSQNITISQNLQKGMNNKEVRALQEVLSTDKKIYPAEVTGYFGPITENAVKAFQKKYGIVENKNIGGKVMVGEATRSVINEIISTKTMPVENRPIVVPVQNPTISGNSIVSNQTNGQLSQRITNLEAQVKILTELVNKLILQVNAVTAPKANQ